MNYRHHYHAGNFADVVKHVLLGHLIRALQRKEKGFLFLDTHSGRGLYDLALAATGQTRPRPPEYPAGIGRVIGAVDGGQKTEDGLDLRNGENAQRLTLNPASSQLDFAGRSAERSSDDPRRPGRSVLPQSSDPLRVERSALSVERFSGGSPPPPAVQAYLELVKSFDQSQGNLDGPLRFYPGSPWIARRLARPQDRLAFCELQEEECLALRATFSGESRTAVHELDGYLALKAMLPPPEKRALVLIDPPYEAQDEWARLVAGLKEALLRFPSGVYAVWYPLTERARLDAFAGELLALRPPPTLVAELEIAGENSGLRLRGCGLVILNPPWQFDREAESVLRWLAPLLAQAPGARFALRWLVPEQV